MAPRERQGVLMPWIRRTLRPVGGPHSKTRIVPYCADVRFRQCVWFGGLESWLLCGYGRLGKTHGTCNVPSWKDIWGVGKFILLCF